MTLFGRKKKQVHWAKESSFNNGLEGNELHEPFNSLPILPRGLGKRHAMIMECIENGYIYVVHSVEIVQDLRRQYPGLDVRLFSDQSLIGEHERAMEQERQRDMTVFSTRREEPIDWYDLYANYIGVGYVRTAEMRERVEREAQDIIREMAWFNHIDVEQMNGIVLGNENLQMYVLNRIVERIGLMMGTIVRDGRFPYVERNDGVDAAGIALSELTRQRLEAGEQWHAEMMQNPNHINLQHGICPICEQPLQFNIEMNCVNCDTPMVAIDKIRANPYGSDMIRVYRDRYHKKNIPEPEFVLNEYLTVKLERKGESFGYTKNKLETNIYVAGKKFRQCKYLLLNIDTSNKELMKKQETIESIDEAKELLSTKMESDHNIIPPETEFWGHCSNLQAWMENNYNVNILHSNLSFPLLKALIKAGCKEAEMSFKEQVVERILKGKAKALIMLKDCLEFLDSEEIEMITTDLLKQVTEEDTISTFQQWDVLYYLSKEIRGRKPKEFTLGEEVFDDG